VENISKSSSNNLTDRSPRFEQAEKPLDKGLLLAALTLIGLGLVHVYSASFIFAYESKGDGLFFVKKQFVFAMAGIVVLLFASRFRWKWWSFISLSLWIISVVGIILTYVPGIGVKAGGAARWISLGALRFEPSELFKIALPMLVAHFFASESSVFGQWKWPIRWLIILTPMALILKQPDFGTTVICTIVLFSIFFCFGLKTRYILGAIGLAVPAFYFLVVSVDYRYHRLMTFLNPWQDPEGRGFQVIQSMLGFHSGGFSGVGLGQGLGKLFFLPEAHTDFTLSVLGEELGFLGVLFVLSLYYYVAFKGFQTAVKAPNRFTQVAALGVTMVFVCQVVINAGVAMGMLPTKGLTLPFLSYGGSSLLMMCFSMGLLLNIRRFILEK